MWRQESQSVEDAGPMEDPMASEEVVAVEAPEPVDDGLPVGEQAPADAVSQNIVAESNLEDSDGDSGVAPGHEGEFESDRVQSMSADDFSIGDSDDVTDLESMVDPADAGLDGMLRDELLDSVETDEPQLSQNADDHLSALNGHENEPSSADEPSLKVSRR